MMMSTSRCSRRYTLIAEKIEMMGRLSFNREKSITPPLIIASIEFNPLTLNYNSPVIVKFPKL